MFTWATRRQCKTKADAMQALADLPLSEFGTILHGYDFDTIFVLKGRAEEFAEIWGIPFNEKALVQAAKKAENELGECGGADELREGLGQGNGWNSSTSICY